MKTIIFVLTVKSKSTIIVCISNTAYGIFCLRCIIYNIHSLFFCKFRLGNPILLFVIVSLNGSESGNPWESIVCAKALQLPNCNETLVVATSSRFTP